MTDVQFLFVILGVLYAWECLCWQRRGGVAFSTWLGGLWRAQHPAAMLGNQNGGFIFVAPFPPLGAVLQANQLPFSLGPEGVLFFVSTNVNPGWRPPQTARFLSWSQLNALRVKGKKILHQNEGLLVASTTTLADFWFHTLTEVAKSPAGQHEKTIRQLLRTTLDSQRVETDWTGFRAATKPIRWLVNALFGLVFVVAPLLIGLVGLRLVWLWLLVVVLGLTVTTAVLFARRHRKLWPAAEDERFTQTLILALAPASTIRTLDFLSRPLLEKFHPLAVAKVLLSAREFRRFARRLLLDLRHPVRPTCPNLHPAAVATEAFFRRAYQESVEAWLAENHVSPDELAQPAVPTDDSCRTYCPRCEAQFTAAGNCTDCGGIPLVAFPKPS